jgi:cytochrome c oxidase subunit III
MAEAIQTAAPQAPAVEANDATAKRGTHVLSGWYGMWWLIATEGALFGYLLFAYYYSFLQASGPWPPDGPPPLTLALPNTLVLLASSVAVWLGERSIRRNRIGGLLAGLVAALLLGMGFVAVQLLEWSDKPFSVTSHLYGSFYFVVTGFHMAHVIVGLLVLAALGIWTYTGHFNRKRHEPISIGALYWHFVDAVWLAVFATFYCVPLLGGG